MLETHKSPELRKDCKSCLRLSFRRKKQDLRRGLRARPVSPEAGAAAWTQRGAGKAGRALGSSLLPGQLGREMRAMAGDESYGFQRVILHRVETTLRESFSFSLPGSPEAFFPQLLCIQEGHMPTSGWSDVDAIDINHFHPWPAKHSSCLVSPPSCWGGNISPRWKENFWMWSLWW